MPCRAKGDAVVRCLLMTADRMHSAAPRRRRARHRRIIGAPRRPPLDRSSMSRPGVVIHFLDITILAPSFSQNPQLAPRPITLPPDYPRTAFPYPLSFTAPPGLSALLSRSALWVDRGRADPEGRTRTDGRGRTDADADGRTERRPERARRAERHHDERHHNSSHVFELDTAETRGEHSERPPDESLVV